MTEPTIAMKKSCAVEVKKGETYYWCSCGLSDNQPYCTGAHKGTDFRPLAYTAEEDTTVYFCGCKHTKNQPMCDGTHKTL
jgi:CDGSH-type Zn-finger protein